MPQDPLFRFDGGRYLCAKIFCKDCSGGGGKTSFYSKLQPIIVVKEVSVLLTLEFMKKFRVIITTMMVIMSSGIAAAALCTLQHLNIPAQICFLKMDYFCRNKDTSNYKLYN